MKNPIKNWPLWLIIATLIAIVAVVLRFVGLEQSPKGFYIDEAAISAQVICIQQSGRDHFGTQWPLFSPVLGGGYATPVQIYLGAAWTSVFGNSISSFRALAAFFGALTVLGTFMLAQALWRKPAASVLSALTVAISPWGFLHSRIAWDPSLAPALLIWSLWFLLRENTQVSKQEGRHNLINGISAGLLAALACYTYPPLRLQALLLFPFAMAFFYFYVQKSVSRLLTFSLTAVLAMIPLIWLTLTGEIQGRFELLSIWNPDFLKTQGDSSIFTILRVFLSNFASHFSPDYLFNNGDANLRHSTYQFGQWGWLEILALLMCLWMTAMRSLIMTRKEVFILLLLVAGYLTAVIPAALTWESNPHALRSIAAYPFIGLISGYISMRAVESTRHNALTVLIVALTFSGFFFWDFFMRYPDRSAEWFDSQISQIANETLESATPDATRFLERTQEIAPGYDELALRYYLLRDEVISCRR